MTSGRPSTETTRRFGGALRREVGDLEVRLEEAHLRSSAFEQAGLHREAAKVLDESRQLVTDFHVRLSGALAQAAVEREAERILASSDDVLAVLHGSDDASSGVLLRIPAGIGAAIASVVVLAMALVTLRAPSDRDLQAANDISAIDEVASPSLAPVRDDPLRLDDAIFRSLTALDRQVLELGSVNRATVAPLLVRRRDLLQLLASPHTVTSAVLAELDALVAQLLDQGVDVERLLARERDAAAAEGQQSGSEPAPAPQQPEPQPEPSPEPSSEEAGPGDGGLVPWDGGDDEGSDPDAQPSPSPSPSPSPTSSKSDDEPGGDGKGDAGGILGQD